MINIIRKDPKELYDNREYFLTSIFPKIGKERLESIPISNIKEINNINKINRVKNREKRQEIILLNIIYKEGNEFFKDSAMGEKITERLKNKKYMQEGGNIDDGIEMIFADKEGRKENRREFMSLLGFTEQESETIVDEYKKFVKQRYTQAEEIFANLVQKLGDEGDDKEILEFRKDENIKKSVEKILKYFKKNHIPFVLDDIGKLYKFLYQKKKEGINEEMLQKNIDDWIEKHNLLRKNGTADIINMEKIWDTDITTINRILAVKRKIENKRQLIKQFKKKNLINFFEIEQLAEIKDETIQELLELKKVGMDVWRISDLEQFQKLEKTIIKKAIIDEETGKNKIQLLTENGVSISVRNLQKLSEIGIESIENIIKKDKITNKNKIETLEKNKIYISIEEIEELAKISEESIQDIINNKNTGKNIIKSLQEVGLEVSGVNTIKEIINRNREEKQFIILKELKEAGIENFSYKGLENLGKVLETIEKYDINDIREIIYNIKESKIMEFFNIRPQDLDDLNQLSLNEMKNAIQIIKNIKDTPDNNRGKVYTVSYVNQNIYVQIKDLKTINEYPEIIQDAITLINKTTLSTIEISSLKGARAEIKKLIYMFETGSIRANGYIDSETIEKYIEKAKKYGIKNIEKTEELINKGITKGKYDLYEFNNYLDLVEKLSPEKIETIEKMFDLRMITSFDNYRDLLWEASTQTIENGIKVFEAYKDKTSIRETYDTYQKDFFKRMEIYTPEEIASITSEETKRFFEILSGEKSLNMRKVMNFRDDIIREYGEQKIDPKGLEKFEEIVKKYPKIKEEEDLEKEININRISEIDIHDYTEEEIFSLLKETNDHYNIANTPYHTTGKDNIRRTIKNLSQEEKNRLKKRGIEIPDNISYTTVDYNTMRFLIHFKENKELINLEELDEMLKNKYQNGDNSYLKYINGDVLHTIASQITKDTKKIEDFIDGDFLKDNIRPDIFQVMVDAGITTIEGLKEVSDILRRGYCSGADIKRLKPNISILKSHQISGQENLIKFKEVLYHAKPENLQIIIDNVSNISNKPNVLKEIQGVLCFAQTKNLQIIIDNVSNISNKPNVLKEIQEVLCSAKPENIEFILQKILHKPEIVLSEKISHIKSMKDIIIKMEKKDIEDIFDILGKKIDTKEFVEIMIELYECGVLGGVYSLDKTQLEKLGSYEKTKIIGYIELIKKIKETSYDTEKKRGMIKKIIDLDIKEAEKYIEVFQIFDNSISQDIQHIKNELIEEVLNSDNPKNAAEKINGIFTKNNLPLIGKIYKVFNELYKDNKLDEMFSQNTKLSPILRSTKNNLQKRSIIYKDLVNIHIRSGNQSLKNYIEIFIGAEKTLRKFENIIKDLDYTQDLLLEGILTEKEQEKLLYLFRKLDTLYESTSGNTIPEPENMEKIKLGESTVNDKAFIEYYTAIRKRMMVREGESLYDNMIKFLKAVGFKSFEEAFQRMNESKKKANERGIKYMNGGKIQLEKGDFIKGIQNLEILENILNRGCVSREYLGGGDVSSSGKASSDMTPFDIDGGLVTDELSKNSFHDILSKSVSKGYGPITLVIKGNRGAMVDTTGDNIEGYTNDVYELFQTGVTGNDHYGIRTGIPSTEIDFIIWNMDKTNEDYNKLTEQMFYEIAKNGFYIPVADQEGNIIFTPDIYHTLRLGMNYADRFSGYDIENDNGIYREKKQDNTVNIETNKNSDFYKLINENKSDNPKYKEHAEKNIKMRDITLQKVKHILEENNVRINSEFDLSIEGAQVNDTGSTGRGTDIPTGDVDLDFTVLLDARDYERIDEIVKKVHEGIGTTEQGSGEGGRTNGYQLKSKKNNLGNEVENRPDGIALDLLFMKKTQVIEYSSSDAAKDRLEYILKTHGKESYDQVRANIIIMKKLLKAKSIYKKPEGGISGIGVENWILQNHGNFIEALESFEKVAYQGTYEKGKEPISFNEFQQQYPIYDPGENYKDGGKDNYIFKMKQEGYNGTLEIIREYREKGIDGIKKLLDEYVKNKEQFGAI